MTDSLQPSSANFSPALRLSCRSCGSAGLRLVIDLGVQPLANSYISPDSVMQMEPHYPLVVFRCQVCGLVQIPELVEASRIFSEYQYLSSYSTTWLEHARRYVDSVPERFKMKPQAKIVEVASNDGYLLQYAAKKGFSVLGVEPAANVARIAEERGVRTHVAFFGADTARQLREQGWEAELMVANNVLAHVPNVNDFVKGFSILLAPEGVATFEFPHLLELIRGNLFDTIYHEHFSYLSLLAAQSLFARHGLRIFDVEKLPTHGGSLRLYVSHSNASHQNCPSVERVLSEERTSGLDDDVQYQAFSVACRRVRTDVLKFLVDCAVRGEKVCAYGAAAKGNTLLNFCGIRQGLVAFVADRNPYKQGHLLPGSRIPIRRPEDLVVERPDYVLILPWNLKTEIAESLRDLHADGCRFVTAIPRLQVF